MKQAIRQAKDDILHSTPSIFAERAKIITETYKNNKGLPAPVLRGQALYDILSKMEIVIFDGEIIVGNTSVKRHSAQIFPEFSTDWLVDEINDFPNRKSDPFQITEKDKTELFEALSQWDPLSTTKGRSVSLADKEAMLASKELVYTLTALSSGLGHIAVNYGRLLSLGTSGITDLIEKAEAGCTEQSKLDFYKGAKLAMKALEVFAERFVALAESKALTEKDENRKKELLNIAKICRRVPKYPAESFHEALQSFWFLQMCLQIESNGHSISPGRFDQYMYPYYKKDIDAGIINKEEAKDLLEACFIKFNEVNKLRDHVGTLAFGGYPMFQNLIIGGMDADGNDATNDLSLLIMDAAIELKMPQPSFSVRWHKNLSKKLLDKCSELSQTGVGMPAYFNDEIIVPLLVQAGCTLEEARGYAEVGCVEPQAPGQTEGLYSGGFMNLCKVLEITLNNGVNPTTGSEYGLKTGTEFETFEDFYQAYYKQLHYFVNAQLTTDNIIDESHSLLCPTPLVSCFVDDCIADGIDVRSGGAKYNYTSPNIVGLANAADSLEVIRKKVFEEKSITLPELVKILNEDYEGNEVLRQQFINDCPKFGNDIPEVDELARRVAADYCDIVHEYTNFRGGKFEPGLQSISAHAMFVGTMGATPDGRRASDLVSDGGVSPAQGRDVEGVTAVLKSVARLDHSKATNGALLNIKFHPSAVKGERGIEVLDAIVNSFFTMGGQHVQFNVVGTEELHDAQKNPDNHRDLVVRVAGFSVTFTAVDRTLQNDIIERTENRAV